LILANNRCVCEVVDTLRGRHTFMLNVPGVAGVGLPRLLQQGPRQMNVERVEGMLVEIRDENLQSSALTGLAAMRLGVR
jgi:hypothetical protein